ncbi:magnesium transporter [Candidatus Izemoplasma sp. B36]|uniref:magnesium transporter n=1 Tax=Candidatus Izemoplasma sp. B36 TaxID=3242468 RepID=UPI0035583CC9
MDRPYDALKDYQSEIISIILNNESELEMSLEEYHLYDISRVVTMLEPENISSFFSKINDDFSASIFEYLETDEAIDIIKYLPESKIIKIIEKMEVDEAVDLLKYLQKEGVELLDKFSIEQSKDFSKFMAYKEDEIGAYMSDSFLTIDMNKNVKDTMKYVTLEAHDTDYISIIYVTENEELIGYLRLKDLIVARANELIKDIMETRFEKVLPTDDYEAVSLIMQDTNESSIPIVDQRNHLIGIVTHDDLMDIIDLIEEEDYTKFAAISDSEISLESGKLKNSVKSRLPWLSVLLILSMLTSIILSFFEQRLSVSNGAILLASRLAVYLPLILGMAGNTGTQSLAVMIRYLTKNDEIDKQKIKTHLFREFKTGILQGFIICILIFGMIIATILIRGDILNNQNLIYAIVTSGSVFIALSVATILGAAIPLMMNTLKIDPAVASGPFITTVSDIITLSIYYSVSLAILLPLFG